LQEHSIGIGRGRHAFLALHTACLAHSSERLRALPRDELETMAMTPRPTDAPLPLRAS
jgi:hypothetical protein